MTNPNPDFFQNTNLSQELLFKRETCVYDVPCPNKIKVKTCVQKNDTPDFEPKTFKFPPIRSFLTAGIF